MANNNNNLVPLAASVLHACTQQTHALLVRHTWLSLPTRVTVQVGELSASQLQLSSGGGAIAVQRMFGRDVQVLSQGGPISIGALYGVKAHLDSCRGAMSLGHMACSGPAMLESGGASLTVDGLEGNASLISSGGDVKVGARCCLMHHA